MIVMIIIIFKNDIKSMVQHFHRRKDKYQWSKLKSPGIIIPYNEKISIQRKYNKIDKQFNGYLKNSTIFVAISSFRDKELCLTIEDLFSKAMVPERVFVGIVQQNDYKNDEPCCFAENSNISQYLKSYNLRILTWHYSKAKGPTYARSFCERLWNNEDYFMQIDSHMRFEYGWDCALIHMLFQTPRPYKTVITMYPEGYERIEDKKGNVIYKVAVRKGWRRERFKYFNKQGIVEFESVTTNEKIPDQPQFVPFWAACFSFAHSNVLKEVPYHPDTPFLFFGEEIFMTARLFTHGWDLKGPTFSVVYHLWKRDYRPTYWSQDKIDLRDKSIQLVHDHLLGKRNDLIYSSVLTIGNERSLEEFWNYVGLDPINKTKIRPSDPWTPF